jgi:hypothetical protein
MRNLRPIRRAATRLPGPLGQGAAGLELPDESEWDIWSPSNATLLH